jgi:tRNA threonylcarbamoyladenosine biosynthesis protein TsaE
MNYVLQDESKTLDFAKYLSEKLKPGMVIGLQGDIGMGKTCLVRAILRNLGIEGAIKSPTFTLVESYVTLSSIKAHHFDLYRLLGDEELEFLGFRDYVNGQDICFIEWPEKAPNILGFVDFMIEFSMQFPGRCLTLEGKSPAGKLLIEQLKREPWLGA